ncbi:MAG: PD40 domain-containing protein [Cyclobacteriaceae bacterium]|nr:PD40 domain-containing protein [Cyclobacteriaceae bacterium]
MWKGLGRRCGVFAFAVGLSTLSLHAQPSMVLETNAPALKWYQLNTPNFRLLYPQGFELQAQRVANTLETVRDPEARTMGVAPRKISIILQNQSSISNGFVAMAPRRSEFYTMPSQNYNFLGTNDWLDALSVHEYRHMSQFQRSLTGFNKGFSYVFGQQFTAAMAFAAAPQWFWEGDAVAIETAYTGSGRGRIPQFDLLFRTNAINGRSFNYHKQYLRSYKHNIPDHYVLGYNLVSHLRKKTGDPMIWEKVVGRSWKVPFIPFAFSNALKKETGMYVTDLYRDMAAQRQKDYEQAVANLRFSTFETLNRRQGSAYTDYQYPRPLSDGRVLVMKSGIGDIDQLVSLTPEGKEERVFVQGIVNEGAMLSVNKDRVVWNEFRFDPRWRVKTYSVVMGYDVQAKVKRVISNHSRYSGAAIAPDGIQVATVETREDYTARLTVLSYVDGSVIRQFENPGNDLLAMPRWTEDGKSILVLRTSPQGKTISIIDAQTGAVTDLLPRSLENVGHPVSWKNYVLFNSPTGGIDNIHAVNVKTGKRFRITTSRFGAFNPAVSPDGTRLYYNDQTRDGLDVVHAPIDTTSWITFEGETPSPNLNFSHLVEQEGHPELLKSVTTTSYESKRYRRAAGMINPHSWGPYLVNSLTTVNVGITSQDILSTTRIDAGYTYDINEEVGRWAAGISYQGLYPIIDVRFSQADRRVNEGTIKYFTGAPPDTATAIGNLTFSWHERTVETGLRVPLLTTRSKYLSSVEFSNYVGITQVTGFTNTIDGGGRILPGYNPQYFFRDVQSNGTLRYNHFSFNWYSVLKRSRRDINPKWGQTLFMDYFNTPYGGDFSGGQFSIYGITYLPGLFKHHSLWGYVAYQNSQIYQANATGKGWDNYVFANGIPLVRGQSVARFQEFNTLAVNYTFPLWYPDIALGPLLNFQRLRVNLFADYGLGSSTFTGGTFSQKYTSVGTEVKVDLNIMRFLPQFNIGFRYSYGITPSVTRFEWLIGSFNF